MFRFKCIACDEWHEGIPAFGAPAPAPYYDVPGEDRERRCQLSSDLCIIDDTQFFVLGRVEIAVHGENEPFAWLAWVSLSEPNFLEYESHYEAEHRAHLGPYFGWFSDFLPSYPNTFGLKSRLHPRDHGQRPLIELEPTEHPLAIEQREGISVARLAEIFAICMHGLEEKGG